MCDTRNLIEKIKNYQPKTLIETPLQAAVMVILLTTEVGILEIVLTKRADTLPTYAGHYSFPGGMRDTSDTDLYATAVRETLEELNISGETYQYVGQLDDFLDRYSNLVRPFVAIMKKKDFEANYKGSEEEISGIYYFSLANLDGLKDDPTLHAITRRRPSYAFTENTVFVWGLTATILVHLYNVIAQKNLPLGKGSEE